MKPNLTILAAACSIAAIMLSCGKQESLPSEKSTEKKSSAMRPLSCVPVREWTGTYVSGVTSTTVSSSTFINNGAARITGVPEFPGAEFWTSIKGYSFQMEYCGFNLAYNGDNVTLKARVKNLTNRPQPKYWDVGVSLIGSQSTASAIFIGGAEQQIFAGLKVGAVAVMNAPELIDQFNDYREIQLTSSNNILSVYLDGVLQKTLDYTGTQIGQLMNISIDFKGSGYVDWVELVEINSSGSEIKMREDFDNDNGMRWFIDGVEVFY